MFRVMRSERQKRGWTRDYVAAQTGMTAEGIRLIDTGKRSPSYAVLLKLEDLFQMNHRELFTQDPKGE